MDENPDIIKITESDVKALKNSQSPKEKHLNLLSDQATAIAKENLVSAKNLGDFLKWHRAALFSRPEYIDWIIDIAPNITAEEIIAEQVQDYSKEAYIVQEMVETLDKSTGSEDKIKLTLKRVREPHGHDWTYRVLALFPEGTKVVDPVLGHVENKLGSPMVYFEPKTACVLHACDDLFKSLRDDGGVAYLPNLSIHEATNLLKLTPGGTAEYVMSKTETGRTKQDNHAQILVGLLGGYSNESLRVRVSDFFDRNKV